MSDQLKYKLYEWAEWVTKAVLVAICGLLWQMNLDITRSLHELKNHGREIAELKAELSSVKQGYVSRNEAMDMMKRVEQQLEILVLQSKLKEQK
jgi:citrate synthase